jgi:hypothetical protein
MLSLGVQCAKSVRNGSSARKYEAESVQKTSSNWDLTHPNAGLSGNHGGEADQEVP